MNTIFPVLMLLLIQTSVNAHSGKDPADEIAKKRSYVLQYQKDYQMAGSQEERITNIKKQVSSLQTTVLILRRALVKENAPVVKSFSNHDLNYLAAMKNSLKDMKILMEQIEEISEGNGP
jgi:hypothetical protein